MRESNSINRLIFHGVNNIPSDWELSKVKYIAKYINGYPFKPKDWSSTGKPIIRIQNLTNKNAEPNRYKHELEEC